MRLFEDFYAPMDWNWVWIDCQVWQDCAREQFSMSVGQYECNWNNNTSTLIFVWKMLGWVKFFWEYGIISIISFQYQIIFGINHIRFPNKTTTVVLSEIDSASNIVGKRDEKPLQPTTNQFGEDYYYLAQPGGADFEGKSGVGTLTPYVNHFGIILKWSHLFIERWASSKKKMRHYHHFHLTLQIFSCAIK